IPSGLWRDRFICTLEANWRRRCFERGRKSRSSDFRVILRPRLSVPLRDSGIVGAFVVPYSGATVRDLHPVPYSPGAVATGTLSHTDPQYFVAFSKNYTISSVFSLGLSSQHFRILQDEPQSKEAPNFLPFQPSPISGWHPTPSVFSLQIFAASTALHDLVHSMVRKIISSTLGHTWAKASGCVRQHRSSGCSSGPSLDILPADSRADVGFPLEMS